MARPREFDIETALDRALEAFWTHGYEATSLDDLQRTMKLSKSSFYAAFGAKHDLFLRCLDRYTNHVGGELVKTAALQELAPALLDKLMARVIDLTHPGGKARGCLLGNTSLELGGRDPRVQRRVRKGLDAVESVFAEVVRSGVARGELDSRVDPKAAGRFLTSSLQGMLVMARAGTDRPTLAHLRRAALSTLEKGARS